MSTFISTLPDDLLDRLSEYARKLKLPKNKLIETVLSLYLDHLKRSEFIKSCHQAATDSDLFALATEGMEDHLTQLENEAR